MIVDAQDARDKIDSLLLDEDVEGAIAIAQTLWLLCGSSREFETCVSHMLGFARGEEGHMGEGADPGRLDAQGDRIKLSAAQVARVADAVQELRQDLEHNLAMMTAPREHLLASHV